jgi:hypothetical protein
MPKKILQDVVVIAKKERRQYADSDYERDDSQKREREESHMHHAVSSQQYQSHDGVRERIIEETMPKITREERKKEATLEQSPIFEQMRQKHVGRKSFSEEYISEKKRRWKKYTGWIIAGSVTAVALILVAYNYLAYGATVTLSLKNEEIALNGTSFTAGSKDAGGIPFQVMTVSKEEYAALVPTGEKEMNSKATGKITIYNEFGTQSQILIKNTRFQTPDGKIFRIGQQIVVPGAKTVNGKQSPGSIEVSVTADESGPGYNIEPTNFTIPGFKGTPRYEKFYAKSTEQMSGGAEGKVKIVSDADVRQARENLTKVLREKLLREAQEKLPDNLILFPDAVFYTFTNVLDNSVLATEKDVKFTLKGTLDAVLFDADILGNKIARERFVVAKDEKITVLNVSDISFAWKIPTSAPPKEGESASFLLTGSAKAVWGVDINLVKTTLAGKNKTDFSLLLKPFTGLESSRADVTPFWRKVFPKDTNKIYVNIIES